jgi:hypothetical protein
VPSSTQRPTTLEEKHEQIARLLPISGDSASPEHEYG